MIGRPTVLDLRGQLPGDLDLAPVVDHLRDGGLLAYPTETVYGLGCLVRSDAVQRLASLKGRDADKPMLLLVPDAGFVDRLAWTPEARELASVFWPGALTLVLGDPDGRYPPGVRSPERTVAVRVSSSPFVVRLLQVLGEAITSTSANPSGGPPATDGSSLREAVADLDAGAELMVLDAGPLPPSPPSTIVDCTRSPPRVLRSGATPPERLRCVLPEIDASNSR